MDKIVLIEDVYGIITVANGDKLPEDAVSFTLIDQTVKDENGMSKKSEWTIGRPVKSFNLKFSTSVFGLPIEKIEGVCTLVVLREVDPEAEWLCTVAFSGTYPNYNNSWTCEGTQLYFNGEHNEEISVYSKKVTDNMTICADANVLASQYEEVMKRDQLFGLTNK